MSLFDTNKFQSNQESKAAISPNSKPEPPPVVENTLAKPENPLVTVQQEAQNPKPRPTDPTVTTVVSYLEREGVLRSRVDPDTGQSVVQLYHDYLSRAVVEAERRADRWPTVIRDAQQQFDEAGSSWPRRWRAMLSPWQQIRMLIERLRPNANFAYGPQKKYAAYSLCRFMPHMVVMLVLMLGWNTWEAENKRQLDRAEARKIMAVVDGTTEYPSADEYRKLERLADSSEAVRLAFIDQLLETEESAESLKHRYAYVLHAVVGLDVVMRDNVRQRLLNVGPGPSELPFQTNWAIAELGKALQAENAALDRRIIASYVAAMKETNDSDALSSLGRALGSLGEKLDTTSAKAGVEQILATMKETTDPRALSSLGSALGSLGEKLDATSAKAVAEQIIAAMKETTDSYDLSFLGRALGSLGEKLDATSAKGGAEQILAAMKEATDSYDLSYLGSALGSLGEKLDATDAKTAAEQIVAAMKETTDSYPLSYLGRALGSLGEKLDATSAKAGAEQILAAMKETTDPRVLSYLGSALGSLGEKLDATAAKTGAEQILAAMKETTDPHALSSLWSALGSLGTRLEATTAKTVAQQIVAAMKETTDPYALSYLRMALGSLGAEQILAAMKETTDPHALSSLWSALGSLGEKLDATDAETGAEQILAAMKEATDSYDLSYLGSALGSLGEKLDATSAKAGAEQILAAMKEATDSHALSSLWSALGSLGEKLDATDAKTGAEQIVAAMKEAADFDALTSLSKALETLVGRLETPDLLGIVKSVVCVGEFQKGPLAALNAKAGFAADGNLWKAVAWARKQEIDINAVPRWPVKSQAP
jgi:hypothetical protein